MRPFCLQIKTKKKPTTFRLSISPFLTFSPSHFQNSGPLPMHDVVPSAVSAADAAATTMRSNTSQILLCFMVHLLS